MSVRDQFNQKLAARSPYSSHFWLNEQQQYNPLWGPLHDRMWSIENEQTPPPSSMDNFYRNERQQRDPNYPVPDPAMDREMQFLKEGQNRTFDDSRAYQVADASGGFAGLFPSEQPAFGSDSTQARRLADEEVARRNSLNGLSSILEELQSNPDLLDSAHTLTGRGKMALLRMRDRLGIDALDIGPEDERRLGDSTAYKQELLTRVNQYIKDITGAQVGQGQETRRLMAVQANESDSPTQVIAKIANAMEMARLDIARFHHMQRTGGDAPTDSELRGILKSRGKELYDAARAQGLSPDQARMQAAQALSQEFGL